MNYYENPIAVFDSGLGGISVLKELKRLIPQENYIYFGDSKNAPYGSKSIKEVCELTISNIAFLIEKSAKLIVVACNTATSASINILRKAYNEIPIIGIEPALKPAIIYKLHGRILVLATEMTLREEKFNLLLNKYHESAEIINLPAPGIVELVEKGIIEGPVLDSYIRKILAPYKKQQIDAIVLGCTHFPFVKKSITEFLKYKFEIFDGILGTVKETKRQLIINNILNQTNKPGKIEFYNSRKEQTIYDLCEKLLESE